MSGADIYDEVKSWGLWREFIPERGTYKTLTATDPIYGGILLSINEDGFVKISMQENNSAAWTKNGGFYDAYGKPVSVSVQKNNFKDENGKFIMSSGWSYEARQLTKRILAIAYPKSADEAYQAILDVMSQKIWEAPYTPLPSALRWLDGRSFDVTLDSGTYALCVCISPLNATEYYEEIRAETAVGRQDFYASANGNRKNIDKMYELHRG